MSPALSKTGNHNRMYGLLKKHKCSNLILTVLMFVYMLLSSVCIAQSDKNDTIYIGTENDVQNNLENKTFKKNSVYFELFGNGGKYSIGYDRIFRDKNIFKLSITAGITFYNDSFNISPQSNLLIGKEHHFELGFGVTLPLQQENVKYISDIAYFLIFRIGYRYQKEDGGVLFRIGFTPYKLFEPSSTWNLPIMPWGGLTIGWAF